MATRTGRIFHAFGLLLAITVCANVGEEILPRCAGSPSLTPRASPLPDSGKDSYGTS